MSRDRFRQPSPEDQELIRRALEGLERGANIISDDVATRRVKRDKDRRLSAEEDAARLVPRTGPSFDRDIGMVMPADNPLTPGGIDPVIQPERGLGPQMGVHPRSSGVLEEIASSPGVASALMLGEAQPLGRALTGAANVRAGGTYRGAQQEIDRREADSPYASVIGGLAGSLPWLAGGAMFGDAAIGRAAGLAGEQLAGAIARGIPALSRVGAAGLEAMLMSGLNQTARGEPLGGETLLSGGLGAGLASIPVALRGAVRAAQPRVMRNEGDLVASAEQTAADLRARAGGGRTIQNQRMIDDLPGGTPEAARWLHETGGSPRYSVHSVDHTRRVAEGVRGRAGRTLDRVFARMSEADAADAQRFAREQADQDALVARQHGDAQARHEAEVARATQANETRGRALRAVEADDPSELLTGTPIDSPEARIGREILTGRLDRRHQANVDQLARRLGLAPEPPAPLSAPRSLASELEPEPSSIASQLEPRGPNGTVVLDEAPRAQRVSPEAATEVATPAAEGPPTGAGRAGGRAQPNRVQGSVGDILRANGLGGHDPQDILDAYANHHIDSPVVGRAVTRVRGAAAPGFPEQTPEGAARIRQLIDELLPAAEMPRRLELPERPEPPRPAGTVDLEPLLGELARASAAYADLPNGAGNLADINDAARRYGATGGRMPFGTPRRPGEMGPGTGAQGQIQMLHDELYHRAGGEPPLTRTTASRNDLVQEQRLLREAQDRAADTVDPELGRDFRDARRDYQYGDIFAELGRDNNRRDAANRVLSQSDYLSVNPSDPWLKRLWDMASNYAFRGREASLGATALEHGSDFLQNRVRPLTGAADVAGRIAERAPRIADTLRRPAAIDEQAQRSRERPATTDAELDYLLRDTPGAAPRTVTDEELERLLSEGAP